MVLQHSRLMRCPGWRATSFTGIYCCSFKHQSLKRQGNLPMEKRLQNLINDIEKQVSANTESINDLGVRINKAGQPFARNDEYRVQIMTIFFGWIIVWIRLMTELSDWRKKSKVGLPKPTSALEGEKLQFPSLFQTI